MMEEFLKCDADGCDHVEPVEMITEAHIGVPCPACGANLLTREDWEAWRMIQSLLTAVEDAVGPEQDHECRRTAVRVGIHGTKTTFEIDGEQRTPPKARRD